MVVLKGIPRIISPELLFALAKMGHGDELGLQAPELLTAILKLLPLDTYVTSPAAVMERVDSDRERGLAVPIWDTFTQLLKEAGTQAPLEKVERFAFYERSKKAFVVVATGEMALYGNLILKKGVIPAEPLQ